MSKNNCLSVFKNMFNFKLDIFYYTIYSEVFIISTRLKTNLKKTPSEFFDIKN